MTPDDEAAQRISYRRNQNLWAAAACVGAVLFAVGVWVVPDWRYNSFLWTNGLIILGTSLGGLIGTHIRQNRRST